ncbi:Alcohol dehydrogenase transcription factor [Operophtera brumata]|uniref:Alcohol dehydrogenase transcription factor n=1 Tax=Operophtera brumata TaxID=104452 RepID=A0A0L7LSX1_OPEBR|nr:Alcohol dehydrogenase transcription factor [Operophtera brumata]
MSHDALTATSKKFWIELIQLFKEHPCLWDTYSPDYLKAPLKHLAYNLLLEKYWEIDGSATLGTLKKKLAIFRSGFSREYRKVKDDHEKKYVPKLWYYPYFKFLKSNEQVS